MLSGATTLSSAVKLIYCGLSAFYKMGDVITPHAQRDDDDEGVGGGGDESSQFSVYLRAA